LIVSQLQDPAQVSLRTHFDLSTVRVLITTSWLLFTIALVLPFCFAGAVDDRILSDLKKDHVGSVALLYVLIGGAFICLSLVVAAYVDEVGFLMMRLISAIPVTFVLMVLRVNVIYALSYFGTAG
jgi:hypothetical protein